MKLLLQNVLQPTIKHLVYDYSDSYSIYLGGILLLSGDKNDHCSPAAYTAQVKRRLEKFMLSRSFFFSRISLEDKTKLKLKALNNRVDGNVVN